MAFVTASLWALVVTVPLVWLMPAHFLLGTSRDGIAVAVLGGALYGLGTVMNGACVFGTAARVLSGKLSYAAALPGIALGAGLGGALGLPPPSQQTVSLLNQPTLGGWALLLLSAIVVAASLLRTVRAHTRGGLGITHILRAARWRTSVAMVVIGVTGGLLFAAGGPWSYPSLLRQLGNVTFGRPASFPVVSIIGPLALIAGGASSGPARRTLWLAPHQRRATCTLGVRRCCDGIRGKSHPRRQRCAALKWPTQPRLVLASARPTSLYAPRANLVHFPVAGLL